MGSVKQVPGSLQVAPDNGTHNSRGRMWVACRWGGPNKMSQNEVKMRARSSSNQLSGTWLSNFMNDNLKNHLDLIT